MQMHFARLSKLLSTKLTFEMNNNRAFYLISLRDRFHESFSYLLLGEKIVLDKKKKRNRHSHRFIS